MSAPNLVVIIIGIVLTHSLTQESPPRRIRRLVAWRSAKCPPRYAWI